MAPVGRWQKGRDLNWYAKKNEDGSEEAAKREREDEIRRIKEAEQEAMAHALGLPVAPKSNNANLTPLGGKEVQKAIQETTDESETARGVGYGAYSGGIDLGGANDEKLLAEGNIDADIAAAREFLASHKSRSEHRDGRRERGSAHRDHHRDREHDRRERHHHREHRRHRSRSRSRSPRRDRDLDRRRDRERDHGRDEDRGRHRRKDEDRFAHRRPSPAHSVSIDHGVEERTLDRYMPGKRYDRSCSPYRAWDDRRHRDRDDPGGWERERDRSYRERRGP